MSDNLLLQSGVFPDETESLLRKISHRKSGSTRRACDRIENDVDWPQEHVTHVFGDDALYENLSMSELMSGTLKVLESSLPLLWSIK